MINMENVMVDIDFGLTYVDPEGKTGGPDPPWKGTKLLWFHSNTDPDPLENRKIYRASHHSMSGHNWPASKMLVGQ